MPSIQYSEKYYDDVYEYRRVVACRCLAAGAAGAVPCAVVMLSFPCCLCALSPYAAEAPSRAAVLLLPLVCRHVVLPPDIAKMLPKQRLLTEVGGAHSPGGGAPSAV